MLPRALTIAVVAVALTGLVVTFLTADAGSHSASDTLYAWVVPAGLITLLATAALVLTERLRRH
jgi:uncharacterized membrane protein YedE/YeeE